MAQPGNFTPILLYGSSTPTNVPLAANLTNSTIGSEIAINVADKNLFFKDSGGVVNTVPIRQSGTSSNGWLSSTDWNTFNSKQPTGTYVTAISIASSNGFTGTSSGGATPSLTLATSVTGLLKGNGTAISAATSGTDYAPATSGTSILYGNGAGGFSNVTIGSGISFAGGTLSATGTSGTVTSVAALTLGTSGTDLSSTVANGTTTPVITLNVPTASATNRGALSAANWTTFNSKAPGVTFTTGYVPFGQGTTSLNQSANLFFDGTNLSVTGSITPSQTAGIIGTTTNNDANTGSVGQYIEATFSVVTVTTTPANMTSISLTAGDWDVSFRISSGGASGTCTSFNPSINTTSATLGTQGINFVFFACDTVNGSAGGSIPSKRISVSSTTTVYGIASCVAGTMVYTTGVLSARRVR